MALSLQLDTSVQSNDAVVLRVTDGTGLYNATTNPGGWLGEAESTPTSQPKVSVIDGSTYTLTLGITIMTSDGTETTYDDIDLYDEFGPFTSVNDLVFDLTPDMLVSSGTALGTSEDQFPDGWYTLVYTFADSGVTYVDSTVSLDLFVDGIVRQKVYDEIRSVPYSNTWELYNNDYKEWTDILYPLYEYSLMTGMLAEVTSARKNEVLDMLATLERILNQRD